MHPKDKKVFSSSVIIGRGDTMSVQQTIEKINCKNLILKTKAILKFPLTRQVIDEFCSRRMANCDLGQIRLFNKVRNIWSFSPLVLSNSEKNVLALLS